MSFVSHWNFRLNWLERSQTMFIRPWNIWIRRGSSLHFRKHFVGHLSIHSLYSPTFNPQGKNGEHLSQNFQRGWRSMEIFQVFQRFHWIFQFCVFSILFTIFKVRKIDAKVCLSKQIRRARIASLRIRVIGFGFNQEI